MAVATVLLFGGNDPSGGAGIAADIETLAACGCQAAPVVTALTVQDSVDVQRVVATPAELLQAQAMAVIADMPLAAVKIGLIASLESVEVVAAICHRLSPLPIVLDPVLSAGGGSPLATRALITALRHRLLPAVTVLTPNIDEAAQLAPEAVTLTEMAQSLTRDGVPWQLITGTHEHPPKKEVHNRLFQQGEERLSTAWPRLEATYHGSGCTLASALAAGLARGEEMIVAAEQAQRFTWESLRAGARLGRGQWHPNRRYLHSV
ncbi:MAG: hydroxymethylpyrimidine/phosphomethylpyrimidine kinase [Gammaproteobacteria bacterium]|nr:hydroxymethylpyrimidine/phosphomethylpyrimidine kinase [Gammaproteobacteria bacterium]